jgi:tetratricopeptide (TPR) repeat protein
MNLAWFRRRALRRDLSSAYNACGRRDQADSIVQPFRRLRYFDTQYLAGVIQIDLGKNDPQERRSATIEYFGDSLRNSRTGPVGLFRELAIAAYETALLDASKKRDLYLKLGAIYLDRQNGTRAKNAAQAESYLEGFLELLGASDHERRGIAHNLLGIARASNPSAAREDFQIALTQFEQASIPNHCGRKADVLINLANLEAEHHGYELAVRYLREALILYRSLHSSADVVLTQRNLAATLLEWARPIIDDRRSEASQLVEEAISLLSEARRNTDSRHDLHATAMLALNHGLAYAFRIETEDAEKFRVSKQEYLNAASIFSSLHEPLNQRVALVGAAGVSFELFAWEDSHLLFGQAMDLLEGEWRKSVTVDERLQLVKRHAEVYGFTLLSAVRANNPEEALRVLERARSRLLRETLYANRLSVPAGVPARFWRRLQTTQQQRNRLEEELTTFRASDAADSKLRGTMRKELDRCEREEARVSDRIRKRCPRFLGIVQPELPATLRELARQLHAQLWMLKPTRKGTAVFVVTEDAQLRHTILEPVTTGELRTLLFGNGGWLTAYKNFRAASNPKAIQFWQSEWLDSMEPALRRLWDLLIKPCLELGGLAVSGKEMVRTDNPNRLPRVYILAGGALDLIPLHAAYYECAGKKQISLVDLADVGFFSSGSLLRASLSRQRLVDRVSQLMIIRDASVSQAEWITQFGVQLFGSNSLQVMEVSQGVESLHASVKREKGGARFAAFCCHAKAEMQNPMKSGLFQSQSERPWLSLESLLGMRTNPFEIVLLNACETALADIDDPADECLSLANAFLATGTGSVVGTQWVADASASALWCAHFLELLHDRPYDPLRAACATSIWLRDSEVKTRLSLLQKVPASNIIDRRTIEMMDFKHPFNWANHKYYGASQPCHWRS